MSTEMGWDYLFWFFPRLLYWALLGNLTARVLRLWADLVFPDR